MTERDELSLERRTGLPDALRVLLEDYPREAWEADPNFSALIRFWLDRHLMFRRLLDVMSDESTATLEKVMDRRTFASHLARYGALFTNELHGHHMIEDRHYFPRLMGLDARISRGFEILDRDHHAIDGHLSDFVASANSVVGATETGGDGDKPVKEFGEGLARLERFLDRHLTDEEDLIVPLLLKHAPDGLT